MFDTELIASNADGTSSSTTIRLRISDENDKPPTFAPYNDHIILREDDDAAVQEEQLPQLTATDGDTGIQCRLKYSLAKGQELFSVNETSGKLALNSGLSPMWTAEGSNAHVIVVRVAEDPLSNSAGKCSASMFAVATLVVEVHSEQVVPARIATEPKVLKASRNATDLEVIGAILVTRKSQILRGLTFSLSEPGEYCL